MTLALEEPEGNNGRQAVAMAPKSGIDAETIDKLDSEILAALRSTARSRKGRFVRTGSALRVGMKQSTLARRIAREHGIGWKSRDQFVCGLVREALARLESAGLIEKENRREVSGFIVSTQGVRLTARDREFLRSLLIRWDTEPAADGAGHGERHRATQAVNGGETV